MAKWVISIKELQKMQDKVVKRQDRNKWQNGLKLEKKWQKMSGNSDVKELKRGKNK